MKDITRHTFLKQSIGIGALTIINPFNADLFGKIPATKTSKEEDIFFKQLVTANDITTAKVLESLSTEITVLRRALGYDFAILSSAYSTPSSKYYQKEELVTSMSKIIQFLIKVQWADGTLDLGNLGSPPDTAFILEPLCAGTTILLQNKSKALANVKAEIKQFIQKAGTSLAEGGVHTPNHRWVVSAALARINALYPDPKYINRINEWLSEQIFIHSEGHYLERSMIYSEVIDRCLITIARLLNKPELLIPVRKNLEMTYYYLEPNGDLVTIDSRRQDQFIDKTILGFYHDYRYLAIRDNNKEFAAITKFIETVKGFDEEIMSHSLFYFLEEPLLKKPLPPISLPPNVYSKLFTNTHLARIRHYQTTSTIFGGVDWPLIIASGRSTSPNFFTFRKGEAILKYLRLSSNFFSTGYFRSDGLKKEGNKYILYKKLEVPYYQPLPPEMRKKEGDYQLSPSTDGRFWNKMDFENRPVSNVKILETSITVEDNKGVFELTFSIEGSENVPVTIELCFKEGGTFLGVTDAGDQLNNSFLEQGDGEYKFGKDSIKFGPGVTLHRKIKGLEGEMYSSHFGSLRTEGMYVYLTGITPFHHKLTIG